MKTLITPLLNLLYPPLCIHCRGELKQRGPLLCSTCIEEMPLIDANERCRTCFEELYKGRCESCMKQRGVIHRQMAVCEGIGPAKSLLRGIHEENLPCIKAAASLMAYQWLERKWLLPEIIIPLPDSRGKNSNSILSKEVGKIFNVSAISFFMISLDLNHFLTCGKLRNRFEVKDKVENPLLEKRVLLVAPVHEGALFERAAMQINPLFPGQIESMAFIK